MKNLPTIPAQKWKIIMYISILLALLMDLIFYGNNISVFDYLYTYAVKWRVQQIYCCSIYFIYIFLHLLILIGAKKSKSKVLYVILVYWLLQIYWIIAAKFSWVFTWTPIKKFRKSIIGNALWGINTIYFMNAEKGAIDIPFLGIPITRQDRFHFSMALIFIIATIICIKKVKKD